MSDVEDPHPFAFALWSLTPDQKHTVDSHFSAGQVVIARVLGVHVVQARGFFDPYTDQGEKTTFRGGTPQARAVHLSAGPLAGARSVADTALHPLTTPALEELSAQSVHQNLAELQAQGQVIWRRQAQVDAAELLKEPAVWKAVQKLARALQTANPVGLTGEQIETIIGDVTRLTPYRIWTPTWPC